VRRVYRVLAAFSPPRDRGVLRSLVRSASRAGALPADLGSLLESALELPDLHVRDAMVARVDVVAVPDTCGLADAGRHMAKHGHKRLPVFHGAIDDIVGVLHAVDVADALATSDRHSAGQLARSAPWVPEDLAILEAVRVMRTQGAHVLLVNDAQAGFAGLATLKDLVEQLLGPLPAEYAPHDRHSIHAVANNEAIVGAATPLHEIELALNVRFPRGEYVSIGGLVYAHLRHIPRPGDVVELPGMRIEVLSVDGARLGELRIRTAPSVSPDSRLVDIGLGQEVVCGGDVVGRTEHVVPDATTGRVSHFVVRFKDRPVVVPLDAVERTDAGVVYLVPSACEPDRFPTWQMPDVSERTEVVANDEPVGSVRKVVVDRSTRQGSHLVVRLSEGPLLFRDVLVPLSWVRSITPGRVHLTVSRDDLVGLPEYRDDDDIRIDILRRLVDDTRFEGLDRYTLKIEVKGGVVRLTGRVRATAARLAAEQLVAATRGVLSVQNELVADDELAVRVERALCSSGIHVDDVQVSVLLGQVKLSGAAASAGEREAAARLAASVPGVESVVNQLEVRGSGRDVPEVA
jgi:Mg2+/Co2+ transporter CorC/osmotically-inducible protein OsmY